MAKYRLVFKRSVAKDLRAFPNADVAAILKRIQALADDPRPPGCEKLSAQKRYRVRQGIYRILYEIQDQDLVVTVVTVGRRKDVYRN
ncbi:MAG TPA: type II toxin-antitoxin system RelE/ParE family toxin [Geopsychrobacteraceae bacterium]|jgi:mRNA interferase RelE/StbE